MQSKMVPHQIDDSGICTTCQAAANDAQVLQCYDCKTHYHVDCGNTMICGTRSFIKTYKGLKNKENLLFVCDHCLTSRENVEASTLKQQMAEVVKSVTRLTREVAELERCRDGGVQPQMQQNTQDGDVIPIPQQNNIPFKPTTGKPNAWVKPPQINNAKQVKHDINKVTLCIKNDGSEIDMKKVKEVVTTNGIQITRTSVNGKNGDVYVDLPTPDQRDKLLPLLKEGDVVPSKTIVDVKRKCPVITIRNVPNYISEKEFLSEIKAQNPQIAEKLDTENGSSEFSVVFSREQRNPQHRVGDEMVSMVVARVSEDIRECLKAVNDRVYIGFTACRVFDRFYVKSCAACHRFGHYHAECESVPCCGYCGDEDHTSQQCQIQQHKEQNKYQCVNCEDSGKPSVGHSSHWHGCPTYIEQQKIMMMKIPYYAKNC